MVFCLLLRNRFVKTFTTNSDFKVNLTFELQFYFEIGIRPTSSKSLTFYRRQIVYAAVKVIISYDIVLYINQCLPIQFFTNL
jgi:hypothetical protein